MPTGDRCDRELAALKIPPGARYCARVTPLLSVVVFEVPLAFQSTKAGAIRQWRSSPPR